MELILAENVTDGEEDVEPLYVRVACEESITDKEILGEPEGDSTALLVLFTDDEIASDDDPLTLDEMLL